MKKPAAKRTPSASQTTQDVRREVSLQSAWSGPLPPPQALEQFNHVVENGAERIFVAWEKETSHRHKMERRDLWLAYGEAYFGKICALLFVTGAFGLSAYALHLDKPWLSAILAGGTLAAVVGAFVKVQRRG